MNLFFHSCLIFPVTFVKMASLISCFACLRELGEELFVPLAPKDQVALIEDIVKFRLHAELPHSSNGCLPSSI